MSVDGSITIRWTGEDAQTRRQRFEPRTVGGHFRVEQRFEDREWVTEGQEIVSQVGLSSPAAIIPAGNTV